jgi:hypothetical protein
VPFHSIPFRFGVAACLLAGAAAACLLAGGPADAEPRRKVPKSFGHNEIVVAEHETLREQIRDCWNASHRARRENLDLHVIVRLRADGTVREANVLGPASFMNDPWRKSLAESASRALMTSACNPLAVPDEWLKRGERITLTINPAAIF